MATRRTPVRQWEIDRAQAQKLLKRLDRFIMCDVEKPGNKSRLMTDAQVRAALGILKKYVPDLKHIEHTGNPDRPVIQRIERHIIDPAQTPDSEGVPAPAGGQPL